MSSHVPEQVFGETFSVGEVRFSPFGPVYDFNYGDNWWHYTRPHPTKKVCVVARGLKDRLDLAILSLILRTYHEALELEATYVGDVELHVEFTQLGDYRVTLLGSIWIRKASDVA